MQSDLDTFDKKILSELQRDCSLAMDALADRVNLSRNACWRRIKQMEAAGIITGRVAVLDPDKLGCGMTAFVMIRAARHSSAWADSFARALLVLPQVVAAHRMTGDLDYLLKVRVADMAAYDQFYKSLTSRIEVSDISASFVMEDLRDTTVLPLTEI